MSRVGGSSGDEKGVMCVFVCAEMGVVEKDGLQWRKY